MLTLGSNGIQFGPATRFELPAPPQIYTSMILLQRLLGAALAIVFLAAAVLFASIALGIALGVGLAVWAWLWWRSRSLPRRHTIEGEYRDVTPLERLEQRSDERL